MTENPPGSDNAGQQDRISNSAAMILRRTGLVLRIDGGPSLTLWCNDCSAKVAQDECFVWDYVAGLVESHRRTHHDR